MARKQGFKLDRRGVSQLLKGDLGRAATAAARKLADQVRADAPDMAEDVDVQEYTTDRGAASVMIANSGARELQVRDGILTKAAAKVGLEVKST